MLTEHPLDAPFFQNWVVDFKWQIHTLKGYDKPEQQSSN